VASRLRSLERAAGDDPAAWRLHSTALLRAGRYEDARSVAVKAWHAATARLDAAEAAGDRDAADLAIMDMEEACAVASACTQAAA